VTAMETRANHVLIGLFTIIISILAVLFALWASNWSSNRNWDDYDIVFTEAVTGLSTGGIVQYNGINVGEVRRLSLDPQDPRKVVARIRLQADTPVKTDTKAKLAFLGLTGVAQIQLSGGLPESPRLEGTPERPVPVIATEPSALQNVSLAASDIAERVRLILSDENIDRITKTLDDVNQLTGTLASEKQDIADLISNLKQASAEINVTMKKVQSSVDTVDAAVVQQLPPIIEKLDRTLASLDKAAGNANAILGDNRQAIADFSQNGLGQVGPTLTEMRVLVRDLRRVTSRLDRHPAGYLTGQSAPEEFDPNDKK
jgi:phospholipid/cholesterol/gamma-HCH transport system substrate-binding protein